jgi:dephospho-CoA kinase
MLLVGLTGGIGSGKSTVARMLAERGAVVLDADAFAREAIAAGTPGFRAVAERFGEEVVDPDGGLDRPGLAAIVFADDEARRDLEAIVHPEVRRRLVRAIEAHADGDDILVIDSPLLVEAGQGGSVQLLVVVTAPEEAQLERLAADRGMSEEEVRARMAAQMPPEEKAANADVVLDNDGDLLDLERQVERLWRDLEARVSARG